MAIVWKETHRQTVFGKNYGNFLNSVAVIAGVVTGLADTSDQLAAAEAAAKAAYPTGHPDTGLGLIETQARWLRGNTGDADGAIAEVVMTFGIGKAGGVTGGTIILGGNTYTILAGGYTVAVEETIVVKGPGDVDQQTTYGVGRVAGFEVVVNNSSPTRVPNIPVGGLGTCTLFFDSALTVGTGAVSCVFNKVETSGVGLLNVTGTIRKPA